MNIIDRLFFRIEILINQFTLVRLQDRVGDVGGPLVEYRVCDRVNFRVREEGQ